ncbi:MAG TPA: hypothetical protein VE978_28655 [Chitinophagales bacterium]|nr:hypothetical protein [Chitinophagales bacterium]
MGLIKEPRNVDIVFADEELTANDQKRISEFIRRDKAARKKNQTHPKRIVRKQVISS